jgi:hypothetical protein
MALWDPFWKIHNNMKWVFMPFFCHFQLIWMENMTFQLILCIFLLKFSIVHLILFQTQVKVNLIIKLDYMFKLGSFYCRTNSIYLIYFKFSHI